MQRYLEKVAVKGANVHRRGTANPVETGTLETGLYRDLLSVELSADW
jgi:hypothetical protein